MSLKTSDKGPWKSWKILEFILIHLWEPQVESDISKISALTIHKPLVDLAWPRVALEKWGDKTKTESSDDVKTQYKLCAL